MSQFDIQTLIDLLKDSIGVEAAEKTVYEAIKDANFSPKAFYSEEEFDKICEMLKKKGGYINTIVTIATATAHKNIYFQKELVREKKEKEDLVRLNEILERKVEERTKQIKENAAKVEEYILKIENINKELDDFTYIVSHDLKEPLRSISAYSKFIVSDYKDRLDEEGKNYLARIQANVVIMQRLIDDLLEISRLERKKNPFEEANTGNMLNEIKVRMERILTERNVEIVNNDKMPVVFCDRVRLTEVFANLISNAVKYSDKTLTLVEVGCKDTGDYYEFYVKDNGPGIPEEYHEKIFKIFQRLVKKEEKEGSGVGLTIAKKIVEMHNGRIWVESKAGEGSVFHFTISKNKDFISEKKKTGEIPFEKKKE